MKNFKKIALSMTALTLAAALTGCGGAAQLTFSNNVFGGTAPNGTSYKETLSYEVSLITDGYDSGTYFKKNSALSEINYDFNGSYVTEFSIMTAQDALKEIKELNKNISDDEISPGILGTGNESGAYNALVYKTYSKLDISASYDLKTGQEEYSDHIYSTAYFLPCNLSLAPVYTFEEALMSYLSFGSDETEVWRRGYLRSISYDLSEYTVSRIEITDAETADEIKSKWEPKTYGYTNRSLIDNAQLLFALRNLSIDADASASLPTVSASYGEAQTLIVGNEDEIQLDMSGAVIDGTEFSGNMAVKKYSFRRNDNNSSGNIQFAVIQKKPETTDATPDKALLVEYVSPLTTYGTFLCMGALDYKLTEATFA